jgi:hypothetical protein
MGILDLAEEAAGAFAADKGLEALDPNANFLEKAAAAVAGFEGVKMVKDHLDAGQDQAQPDQPQADDQGQTDPNA